MRYNLRSRDWVEMMEERGLSLADTTIMRLVHQYGPELDIGIPIRQIKYLNIIVEQDHCFIKRRIRSMLGFKSFRTATSILAEVEAMHMIKKNRLIYRISLFKSKNIALRCHFIQKNCVIIFTEHMNRITTTCFWQVAIYLIKRSPVSKTSDLFIYIFYTIFELH